MRHLRSIVLLAGVLLFTSITLSAQQIATLSGIIKQKSGEVIEGATIQLLKTDSSLYKTSISDKDGKFEVDRKEDIPLILKISMIGYNDYYTTIPDSKTTKVKVPFIIYLEAIPVSMKEVVVQVRKPMVEMKADRLVVNVDASPGNAGNNVLEVLEKAPGVAVDKDGNISLKGKQAVLVMIDGRPTYLTPGDLANYLRSLPASTIDQLELMTNPPAKYDAAGNAGVINIRTKKNKQQGFNGTYTGSIGQGQYNRNSNSLQLNYRKNKTNVFSNLSYSNWEGFNNLDINRTFKDDSGLTQAIFEQVSLQKNREQKQLNGKIGIDQTISKKTTVGIVVSGFSNPESTNIYNTSLLKNAIGKTDSIVKSVNTIQNTWLSFSGNAYMQHKLDSNGREITADADFSVFNSKGNSLLNNRLLNADNSFRNSNELQGLFPVDISIAAIKTDYTHPLKKNAKFEAGVKSSYVSTSNEANFFNIINTIPQVDYNKTNTFDYRENINAGYVNFSKQWKKWGIQSGLRLENTNVEGLQEGNVVRKDSSFTRSYTNFFPTTYLSFQANEQHQFSLNYGRRIDRPNYQSLNPFVFYIDNYTYQAGNPFLQPQITGNVELTHVFKGVLSTTLNYSKTRDIFAESFTQDNFATIVSTSNIGKRTNFGAAVNAQIQTKKIFSTNIYFAYTHDAYKGVVNGDPLNNSIDMYLISINNQFKFEKGWSAEISGWYRTKGIEGQIIVNPLSQVTMGIQKLVLKNKGTLKFNLRDVFRTNYPQGNINFSKTAATFRNTRDTRVAIVSFVYRFGKNFKPVVRNSGTSDDVKDRVKKKDN